MTTDERWMTQSLALAARGEGFVEPNPMVGAVVLDANGQLVGEGWHQKFGGPHAEVHALEMAGERARGGTLYGTLEPCCHFGKTPPCTDAVLKAGVSRVVVAMADPFPKVDGGGLTILRNAGLEVVVGLKEAEARRLNAPYLKRLKTGQPWVIAKWAMTLDGKIATSTGDSKWISGEESRRRVHELRGRVDAVIVGLGTVIADDPLLTARPPGPRVATRVVLFYRTWELPNEARLRSTAKEAPVLLAIPHAHTLNVLKWARDGAELLELPSGDGGLSIAALLTELGKRGMTNVLVEGGSGILGSFHDAGAIDETWVFIAPKLIGGTGPGPIGGRGLPRIDDAMKPTETHIEQIGLDTLVITRFTAKL